MRLLRSGIVVVVAMAFSGVASAYVQKATSEGENRRWEFENPHRAVPETSFNRQTQSIRFHLAEDAFSEENREAELNAVRASFGQWMSIPDSVIRFEEGPLMSAEVEVNGGDGTNIVRWAKGSTLVNGGRTDLRSRTGLAFVRFLVDGQIVGTDIVLNGVLNEWFADPRNPEEDKSPIETVMNHEIGHLLGLAHTVVPTAIMFPRGPSGEGPRQGLTADEVAFARTQYATAGLEATLGIIEGRVTADGEGVLGAGVLLEDPNGGIVASTISLNESPANPLGLYRFPALTPGPYQVRVFPLAPLNDGSVHVKGLEIDDSRFTDAEINFAPTEAQPVSVAAGQTATQDIQVSLGEPGFRIGRFRVPTENPRQIRLNSLPIIMNPDGSTVRLGVFGEGLPLEDVDLLVTGDGLTVGPVETTTDFFGGLPHIFREVTVMENATPGARSFVLQHGEDRAIAPGLFLIRSTERDDNFDGFSDSYQRDHFAVFTDPMAGPEADPDRDGITNREESIQGTDPNVSDREVPLVDPFEIDRVAVTAQGAVVTLSTSVEGALYQLYARDRVEAGEWAPVGGEVLGDGAALDFVDPDGRGIRFYEVRTVE